MKNVLMENFIAKLGNKYNMIDEKEFTACLTFKVVIPHNLTPILDELYQKAGSEKAVQLESSGGAR